MRRREERLIVRADPELLGQGGHRLVREDGEMEKEYLVRRQLFEALISWWARSQL